MGFIFFFLHIIKISIKYLLFVRILASNIVGKSLLYVCGNLMVVVNVLNLQKIYLIYCACNRCLYSYIYTKWCVHLKDLLIWKHVRSFINFCFSIGIHCYRCEALVFEIETQWHQWIWQELKKPAQPAPNCTTFFGRDLETTVCFRFYV
jgi:hypothetical protein